MYLLTKIHFEAKLPLLNPDCNKPAAQESSETTLQCLSKQTVQAPCYVVKVGVFEDSLVQDKSAATPWLHRSPE